MEKKAVFIDGSKLAYIDKGEGDTIVLLHGFCGSSSYWDSLLPLLPNKYHYIIPELRGHGESDTPDTEYSMEVMAEDIAKLLTQNGIQKITLFGHSLGGYIALAFAERHGEFLNRLGLIHSTAFPDDEKGKEGRMNSIKAIKENGLEPFIDGLIPKLFAPRNVDVLSKQVESVKQIGYKTNVNGAIHTLEGMRNRPDRNHVLTDAKIPVILISGEFDQVIPQEKIFSVKGGNIIHKMIPNAGHMSMIEEPKVLSQLIQDFIN